MASTLNLTKATVAADGQTYEKVGVRVRGNTAQVLDARRDVVVEKGDVLEVKRSGAANKFVWTVTFADESSWLVERKRAGCGCNNR